MPVTLAEVTYASGSPSKGTPRFRRNNRSSISNEVSDEAVENQSTDGLAEEDFRAGGPDLNQPSIETHHEQNLVKIASDSGLHIREIVYCGRRPLLAKPPPQPRLTILMLTDRGDDPTARDWIHIARRMLEYLAQIGIRDVVIEIIDPRFDQRALFFPRLKSDPDFPAFYELHTAIKAAIDQTGVGTVDLDRIGMGETAAECPLTIVVAVEPSARSSWVGLREDIVRVLDKWGYEDVGVLIRWDGCWRGMAYKLPKDPLLMEIENPYGKETPPWLGEVDTMRVLNAWS
ncbi:hypothetical protein BJX62DRAFT_243200 [Aspergillus germanicus]